MTWKAVGPVVQKVVSRIVDTGEGSVAAEPRRPKRAASNAPAAKSFREDTLPAKEVHTDRCMTIANPNELPRSAVVIHLRVIEGGRTTQGRKLDRPTYRDGSWRERARETGLVLVHSAAS
jgi:hypothetical protein